MDDEIKNDEVEQEETPSNDEREEEIKDEIRDEDYANDDEIEMDRSIEKKLDALMGKLDSISDTIAMFVDSGMVIREANPLDVDEDITEEDFAGDFKSIDDLDFSID